MTQRPYKYAPKSAIGRARGLRQASTDAEAIMWRKLRANSMGAKFRRQHPFMQYTLDFYCHEAKLVIEIDGGQHFEPKGQKRDGTRTAALESAGLRIMRFTNLEVLNELDAFLESIMAELRPGLPSP